MKITLLGPPGSGKGSFAKRLGDEFRVEVISVGDILREEVKNKTALGLKVEDLMKKGELISDEIILDIVNKRIEGKDTIIFDGFPRTINQIVDVDKAINLLCSDELSIKRITNRRICNKCKKIYNLITEKPKKKGLCDVCDGKLVSRNDQTEKVVKDRLRVFKRETMPVIEYYKKQGILEDVDAERTIDKIYSDVRKIFISKE